MKKINKWITYIGFATIALSLALGVLFIPMRQAYASGWTLINHKFCSSAGGATCTTGTVDMTGATLIIIVTDGYAYGNTCNSGVVGKPTDSSSNNYTVVSATYAAGQNSGSNEGCVVIYYAVNPTVTSSMTFSNTYGSNPIGNYGGVFVSGWSGNAASPLDQSGATSCSASPGSLTATQNGELYLAGYVPKGSGSVAPSIGSPFTGIDANTYTNGQNVGGGSGYYVQTTAGGQNVTWTDTGGDTCGGADMATFKAPASPPPPSEQSSKVQIWSGFFRMVGGFMRII